MSLPAISERANAAQSRPTRSRRAGLARWMPSRPGPDRRGRPDGGLSCRGPPDRAAPGGGLPRLGPGPSPRGGGPTTRRGPARGRWLPGPPAVPGSAAVPRSPALPGPGLRPRGPGSRAGRAAPAGRPLPSRLPPPAGVTNASARTPPPSGRGRSAYGRNLCPSRAKRMSRRVSRRVDRHPRCVGGLALDLALPQVKEVQQPRLLHA